MKKAESSGIGIFGVIIAIFIVFGIRGCYAEHHQIELNSFCQEKGFDFGKEEIRSTVILCASFDNKTMRYDYNDLYDFKEGKNETRI